MNGLRPFSYHRPASVDEAVKLYDEPGKTFYLAGGTDLMGRLRLGQYKPEALIDIKRIDELHAVEETEDGGLAIGSAVSVADIANNPMVVEGYPALSACCHELGSYPLRQRATMGGNICNASPCADTAPALLCLDAVVEVAGKDGRRKIPMKDFFKGPGQTAMKIGELSCRILLPKASRGGRVHYGRLARRKAVDISTVAVLLVHLPDAQPHHRVALASVAPTTLRLMDVEKLLDEKGAAAAEEAAAMAMKAAAPITDLRGTAEYRREMVGALLKQGIAALSQA